MRLLGYVLFLIGIWMMVSPQAVLGLDALKWMANYAFPGEAFLGALVSAGSILLIKPSRIEE